MDSSYPVTLGERSDESAPLHGAGAKAPCESPVEHYADAPNRCAAFLADALLLAIVSFVAAMALSAAAGPVVRFQTGGTIAVDRGLALADGALATALSAAYFAWGWARRGRTPGMRLVGLRITSRAGSRLTAVTALRRWLVLCGPLAVSAVATPFLGGIGDLVVDLAVLAWYVVLLVSVARSPTKQGLHDRLSGSVLTKRFPSGPWTPPERPDPEPR
jgi:uncharacterized RDD family membrane protein YckC